MPLPPLSPEQRIKPPRFELRLSLLYAAIYAPMGIHLPYFPLWLAGEGFDSAAIAVILSAPLFLRVLTTPAISALADRANDRVDVLIAILAGALLVSLGYMLLPPGFALVLAVSLTLHILWSPPGPLADSLALSGVRRFGSDYARMRIWGSISFLLASLGGGLVLAVTGPAAVPAMISIGLVGGLAFAVLAPRLGRPRRASPLSAADLAEAGAVLRQRYFLLMATGAGLITASHGLLYGFGSIYWASIGIDDRVIGMLWAFGVIAEVLLFVVFRAWFGGMRANRVLAIAGCLALLRWTTFPFVWPSGAGVFGFFAVQALHAFSTGLTMLAVQKMIAETIPEEKTGAAQGVAFFASGFGMAAAMLASGPLYAAFGVDGFFAMAGMAAAGLACIALARR